MTINIPIHTPYIHTPTVTLTKEGVFGALRRDADERHLDFIFVLGDYRHDDTPNLTRRIARAISEDNVPMKTKGFHLLTMASSPRSSEEWVRDIVTASNAGIMPVVHDLYRYGYNINKTQNIIYRLLAERDFETPVLIFLTPSCSWLIRETNEWHKRALMTQTPEDLTADVINAWFKKPDTVSEEKAATQHEPAKSADKHWYDVRPSLYAVETKEMKRFLDACGLKGELIEDTAANLLRWHILLGDSFPWNELDLWYNARFPAAEDENIIVTQGAEVCDVPTWETLTKYELIAESSPVEGAESEAAAILSGLLMSSKRE